MIKISPQQIHNWHFFHPDTGQENNIDFVERFLDQTEIEKSAKIRTPETKTQFINSRAFLRNVLSQYTEYKPKELSFETGEWGKPYIAQNTPIRFNLSHTHNLTSVVITNNLECGIDIEHARKIGQNYLNLTPRIMNERELRHFNTLDTIEKLSTFVSIWTIKEAYIKTLGIGLSYNLTDIYIDKLNSSTPIIKDQNDSETQQHYSVFTLNPKHGYIGACVIESDAEDISYFSTTIDSLSFFTMQRIGKP